MKLRARIAIPLLIAAPWLPGVSPARLHGQDLLPQAREGIPDGLDAMYIRGMQYLVRSQNGAGSWDTYNGSEPGVAGLAVLSMLAHGDDPNYGPCKDAIRKGIDFILSKQDPDTGYIGTSMYNHGFATLALAESYGQVHDGRIGPALQKAVNLILSAQSRNPSHAWRYTPENTDADTTVSGAQMLALFAARNAGCAVPEEAISNGLHFFAECQTPDGGIGYTGPGGPDPARTAIGALVFSLARQQKSTAFRTAIEYLEANPIDDGAYHQYYLYYAAQACFRASPRAFDAWNSNNLKSLAATQLDDGSWSTSLGPTFSTAASLLSLALNYRLLPIYER